MQCCLLQQSCGVDILINQRSKFEVQKYMEGGENASAKWYFYLFKSCVLVTFKTKLLSLGQEIAEICIFRGQDNAGFQTHIKMLPFLERECELCC